MNLAAKDPCIAHEVLPLPVVAIPPPPPPPLVLVLVLVLVLLVLAAMEAAFSAEKNDGEAATGGTGTYSAVVGW